MSLSGNLKTMPLTDLLQWVGSARLSGTLEIERNKVCKAIVFDEGRIVGCSSDDPPARLGQFLLSRGLITEDTLLRALSLQNERHRHLGVILVEMGAIEADELSEHLEAKADETLYSLFDWQDALFRFHDGVRDEANVFPIRVRVEDVLLRGLKRFDEMQRIRQVFHDSGLVLSHTDKEPPAEVRNSPMARRLYEAVDGRRSIASILLHVHGSEYVVTKFLYELHRTGYLKITGIQRVEPSSTPAAESRPAPPPPTPAMPLPEPDPGVDRPAPESTVEVEAAEASDGYRLSSQLARARRHMQSAEHEAALDILDALYRQFPGDASLRKLLAEAEITFIEKAYRHYLPSSKVPVLVRPVAELTDETLSPTEVFLLSRLDGTWDLRAIVQIAPLREIETLRVLKRMRERGVIELRESPQTVD